MKIKKITVISFAFVFLAGCVPYKVGQDEYLSLDEALSRVREQYSSDITAHYLWALEELWRQAPQEDKEIIEKEMLEFLLKRLETDLPPNNVPRAIRELSTCNVLHDLKILKQKATNEEVRTTIDRKVSEVMQAQREEVKREREKQEQEQRDRVEAVRAEFEKSRERLTKMGNGTLKDKSAQEVKKLLDEWQRQGFLWVVPGSLTWNILERDKDAFSANFSTGTFYKIFGKPKKQQYLSGTPFVEPNCYIFYYDCKDGLVQIKVDAEDLDDEGVVRIIDLNIL